MDPLHFIAFLGKTAHLGSELTKRLSSGCLPASGMVQVTSERVTKHFLEVVFLPDVKIFLTHSVEKQ